jgi:ergothioneine biosynthesis protein EgtB
MLVTQNNIEVERDLLARLSEARARTDELFDRVKPEALYDRPIPERHRIIFYLGHLEAFDWNLLRERIVDLNSFHSEFDHLFAFGIDPINGGLPSDQPKDWPSAEKVRDYVERVRQALDQAVRDRLSSEPNDNATSQENSPRLLLNVAIEHRLMHAETLTYMLHQLPLDRKIRPAPVPELVVAAVLPQMVEIPAGSAVLGLSRLDANSFGWDNEYEMRTVAVPPFAIDRHMVTNGQYAEFIAAGGYRNRNLWSDGDWKWKTEGNITGPISWKQIGDRWYYRTMFNEVQLPLEWPVYVSHAEATAYARWVKKILPTEAQWHRAAYGTPGESERPYPWGVEPPRAGFGNFDFQSWNPSPVGAFPAGQSAFGVTDMLGNGWEWTSSVFKPFPGFEPFTFYRGYSADFFDGHHYVMKGGSARTAACMLRRSFRNWFQPHYQYVYSGFRCVSN